MREITNVIFDIEATCEDDAIDPDYEMETIEIGGVKVRDGKIIDTFQTFVKPKLVYELTDYCTNLTGITYADLEDAPYFEEAIIMFFEFIYGSSIYSAGNFDRNMFLKELKGKGSLYIHELVADVVRYSHRDLKKHYTMIMSKPRAGMYSMAKELGIPMEGSHHRALDDALNLTMIYLEIERKRKEKLSSTFNRERMKEIVSHVNSIYRENYIASKDDVNYIIRTQDSGERLILNKIDLLDKYSGTFIFDYEKRKKKYMNAKEIKILKKFSV